LKEGYEAYRKSVALDYIPDTQDFQAKLGIEDIEKYIVKMEHVVELRGLLSGGKAPLPLCADGRRIYLFTEPNLPPNTGPGSMAISTSTTSLRMPSPSCDPPQTAHNLLDVAPDACPVM
jgi:hypothetical protein